MAAPIIKVENLSKRYRLSHLAGQATLRDAMHHSLRLAWRRLRWKTRLQREEFWALKNANFEVQQGEVLGIIGRNGAGKSTLLKLLARITEPTAGRITLRGRVASLLEVGTGFHPELTGRDNIFLNGAILGMRSGEIRKKFDEIVAFAEVERFIDTPVKRYSSGMYVRLAFAVAAHLEPEILIVDEVLAVGDAAFQRKCLGKIHDITKDEGHTVLFVSHNLSAVRQLCTRALVLHQGAVAYDGSVQAATAFYARQARTLSPGEAYRHIAGNGHARITHVELVSAQHGQAVIPIFEPTELRLDYEADPMIGPIEGFVLIYGEDGECIASSFQRDQHRTLPVARTRGRLLVRFDNPLAPGRYLVSAGLFDQSRQFLDWVEFAESFEVNEGFADGRAFDQRLGRFNIAAQWEEPAP